MIQFRTYRFRYFSFILSWMEWTFVCHSTHKLPNHMISKPDSQLLQNSQEDFCLCPIEAWWQDISLLFSIVLIDHCGQMLFHQNRHWNSYVWSKNGWWQLCMVQEWVVTMFSQHATTSTTTTRTKVGRDACGNRQGICGPFCNADTNEKGLRLLEFAIINDLTLANTFGHHKASRRWTWHSPNGQHHNQVDYILVRKCFRSGVNSARTWSFSAAVIGSDHDLLMTFHLRLKTISNPKHTRLKFNLEKLRDPNVLETFKAMIGGRFAPLTIMSNKDTDRDSMITTFNTAVTGTAREICGKHRQTTFGHCRNS